MCKNEALNGQTKFILPYLKVVSGQTQNESDVQMTHVWVKALKAHYHHVGFEVLNNGV